MDLNEVERRYEEEFDSEAVRYQPWLPLGPDTIREQQAIKAVLSRKAGASFAKDSYVARGAKVFTQLLILGERSFIASGAIVRGNIRIGADCSINSYSHLAGKVTLGSGVRIAGHVGIFGFNHGTKQTDKLIKDQPITMVGVEIGDGTWIGSHAVIVDGVTIGKHCVVAAGAIVTTSCIDYQVVGGNPARVLADRRVLNTGES